MADFSVALQPAASKIKIAEPKQSFGITVGAIQPADSAKKVKVTITFECAPTNAALLASLDDQMKVTYAAGDKKTGDMIPVRLPGKPAGDGKTAPDRQEWNTGGFGKALPLSVSLEDFVSNTPPGDAEITVRVQTSTGLNQWSDGETTSINVTKWLEQKAAPALRFFNVSPEFVLHAGETDVRVTFLATGYKTATLYRNNQEVRTFEKKKLAGNPEVWAVTGESMDSPSITSAYRLRLTKIDPDNPANDVTEDFFRTVQVISPGWNQIALPQGTPIRLFVANDFKGSGSDRLYGIFRDQDDNFALYSSATGVDDWRRESGTIPAHMGASPGVYYKNRLWLIGGSSVALNIENGKPANEVWSYEKQDDENWDWSRKSDLIFPRGNKMWQRVGHACVVLPDNTNEGVWVIGGYDDVDRGAALNDVWRLREDPNQENRFVWDCLNTACSWDARVNPAAAVFQKSQDQCEVWIYGGSADPTASGMTDFYSTSDGKTWTNMASNNPPVPIVPDPGLPRGAALVTFPRGDSSQAAKLDRLLLVGSFKETKLDGPNDKGNRIFSFVFEWHPGTGFWESYPVLDGWQQFQGENFYMQAVAFNTFLFCWSLRTGKGFSGKLNVLVSH